MVLQIAADDHGKSHLRRVEGLSRLTSPSEPSCGLLFPPCPGYRHLSGLALDRGRLSAATHPVATEGIRHYVADGSTAAASG
jgi:hypothetical protein